jgi:thiol-disulfide isomerase/thioredoxin
MTAFRALRTASGFLLIAFLLSFPLLPANAVADEGPETLDLTKYGGKVVVVDFWASWCAPCRHSFPWLDSMQRKYGEDGLVVVGINEDNAAEDAEAFLQAHPVSFRIVADRDGALAREFDLIAMPSSYVIGRDGELAVRHLGFKTAKQDEYEAALLHLLNPALAARGSEN